jgi:hypothetical protein
MKPSPTLPATGMDSRHVTSDADNAQSEHNAHFVQGVQTRSQQARTDTTDIAHANGHNGQRRKCPIL